MNDQVITTQRPPLTRPPDTRRPRRVRALLAKLAVLAIVMLATAAATTYWYITRDQASTDDAYTDGRAITIAPQVAGTVVALNVGDNQRVKAGDVLLQIDPRAYAAARDQARGSLQVAEAELG